MKIKFKQLIAGFVFIIMCGCSGAQPFKDAPIKYTPTMMNEIYKQVKTYSEHPYYTLNLAYQNCAIEVWLNDMPQFNTLDESGSVMTLPLNVEILKSGKQKLMLKIYSGKNDKKLLSDSVILEARVEMRNERNDLSTERLLDFKPKRIYNNGKELFDFVGKDTMVYNLEFNASVPYIIAGWGSSKDLKKVPNIEEKVKAFYAHFRKRFADHDSVYFANVMYKKELAIAQALYMTGIEESFNRWSDLMVSINHEKRYEGWEDFNKSLMLKDFRLEFYGNGRVAGLVFKGKGLFNYKGIIYINKEIDTKTNEVYNILSLFPLYLHIPEGSTELEIIR